ncbi:hypothetical protein JQR88_11035 [Pseudomonas luteola]|uniref:hypothetical protein n=1 Tax=Pseudomonas luteola TaxID=47886 RepID=UPI003DA0AC12
MIIGQLVRPFSYLSIRHPYKWVVDWLYPILFALISFFSAYYFSDILNIIKTGGAIQALLSFIQSLPGFYIAALAAIATFGRSDIDEALPEPTPKVIVRDGGIENWVGLTRRRFLAMLFAFLTAQSIVLIIFSVFLTSYGVDISKYTLNQINFGFYLICSSILIYAIMFFQLILATFWGLYYLGHKLHE